MKRTILAVAVAAASFGTVAATSDNVSVYGAIEVGGYWDDSEQVAKVRLQDNETTANYQTDTNATIGLAYDDGAVIGAAAVDAYLDGGVGIDDLWAGYKVDTPYGAMQAKVGLHDSVFDDHSGLGDLAIEFGNGAYEAKGTGEDIRGLTYEYNNDQFYAGVTVVMDDLNKFGGANGAVEFTTGDTVVGLAVATSKGVYEGGRLLDATNEKFGLDDDYTQVPETLSWNIGVEHSIGDFKVGLLHNRLTQDAARPVTTGDDVNSFTEEFEYRATQLSGSYTYNKLTVASSVAHVDGDIDTSDTMVDQRDGDIAYYSQSVHGHQYKATIGASYAVSKEVELLVDFERNFKADDNQAFAKATYEF